MPGAPSGPDPDDDARAARAARLMVELFGHDELQPGQGPAIEAVLDRHDTLAVMATGSGKSAIYQACGAALAGTTVVVSPLIALQRDQVESLRGGAAGEPQRIDSTMSASARRAALSNVARARAEFVFVAPEQLSNEETFAAVARSRPSLVVVDEAHCISEWGRDFRPAYRRLGELIDALGHPTVLALTATAAPPVRAEIVEQLRMRDPVIVVRGFDRPNIHLAVSRHVDPAERDEAVVATACSLPGQGIVYAATHQRTIELSEAIGRSRRATHYHGGMGRRERDEAHQRFVDDTTDVVVATNAFGMGIDKADVRWVIHADAPESLDEYYQEVGRAGRDGEPARAVLFYRPEDIGRQRFHTRRTDAFARSRLEMLRSYCETSECRRSHVLGYFGEPYVPPCGCCDNCDAGRASAGGEVDHAFAPGVAVDHASWGGGVVVNADAQQVTVLFDSVGYRNLSVELVTEARLLTVR